MYIQWIPDSRTSQRNEKWFEIYRDECKFLLTFFGLSFANGTKRLLRIIESLKIGGSKTSGFYCTTF